MPQKRTLKQSLSHSQKQLAGIYAQMRLSRLMLMDENDFFKFVNNFESTSLFKKLLIPAQNQKTSPIRFRRAPNSQLHSNFNDFPDKVIKSKNMPDFEKVLEKNKKFIKIAKKIGLENFKKYVLYNDFDLDVNNLQKKCNIEYEELSELIDTINQIYSKLRFYWQSDESDQAVKYNRIGQVSNLENKLSISFYNLNLARGRYEIDHEKINKLKAGDFFSQDERRKINTLLNGLNLINMRSSTLYKILQVILREQYMFLKTEDYAKLKPLTQKESSKKMDISPSLFNRAISQKSIDLISGQILPLKDLFPSLKNIRKDILKSLLAKGKEYSNDSDLKRILEKNYGIFLSRRSVAKYRQELSVNTNKKKNEY